MNLSHPCRLLFSALLHYYLLLSTTLLIKLELSGPSQISANTPGIAQAGKVDKQRKDLDAATNYWIFHKVSFTPGFSWNTFIARLRSYHPFILSIYPSLKERAAQCASADYRPSARDCVWPGSVDVVQVPVRACPQGEEVSCPARGWGGGGRGQGGSDVNACIKLARSPKAEMGSSVGQMENLFPFPHSPIMCRVSCIHFSLSRPFPRLSLSASPGLDVPFAPAFAP